MTGDERGASLVSYYQDLQFNPVLIHVEDSAVWKAHFANRRNLYERHLGIPLAYLRGASVVEFGPNSGENALLPALFGARLTLVEPNTQVLPRLHELFVRFGVTRRFELVIAEGFLYPLPFRDAMLRKVASLVRPGCFGVISYNDRCGGLLEYLRRVYLFRACELSGVADTQSDACLQLARDLFASDFARLGLTRSFDAWWRDTLVNPFCRSEHTWSLPELLALLADVGCEFHSSSPAWFTGDRHRWYKRTAATGERTAAVLAGWKGCLAYFLTGLNPEGRPTPPPGEQVISDVHALVQQLSDFRVDPKRAALDVVYPASLEHYFDASDDARVRDLNREWLRLFATLGTDSLAALQHAYASAEATRGLWGTAYHYLCFQRSLDAASGP
jgi:hypothetical protein